VPYFFQQCNRTFTVLRLWVLKIGWTDYYTQNTFLWLLLLLKSSGVFFLKFIIIKMVRQCGIFYIFLYFGYHLAFINHCTGRRSIWMVCLTISLRCLPLVLYSIFVNNFVCHIPVLLLSLSTSVVIIVSLSCRQSVYRKRSFEGEIWERSRDLDSPLQNGFPYPSD